MVILAGNKELFPGNVGPRILAQLALVVMGPTCVTHHVKARGPLQVNTRMVLARAEGDASRFVSFGKAKAAYVSRQSKSMNSCRINTCVKWIDVDFALFSVAKIMKLPPMDLKCYYNNIRLGSSNELRQL